MAFEAPPEFGLLARIKGPGDSYLAHITGSTGTSVVTRGRGSGVSEGPGAQEPLHLLFSGPSAKVVEDAKTLAQDLINTVRREFNTAYPHLADQQAQRPQSGPPQPQTMPPAASGGYSMPPPMATMYSGGPAPPYGQPPPPPYGVSMPMTSHMPPQMGMAPPPPMPQPPPPQPPHMMPPGMMSAPGYPPHNHYAQPPYGHPPPGMAPPGAARCTVSLPLQFQWAA